MTAQRDRPESVAKRTRNLPSRLSISSSSSESSIMLFSKSANREMSVRAHTKSPPYPLALYRKLVGTCRPLELISVH